MSRVSVIFSRSFLSPASLLPSPLLKGRGKESFWAELDLNQRRHCQRSYNPPPLTTRASTLLTQSSLPVAGSEDGLIWNLLEWTRMRRRFYFVV